MKTGQCLCGRVTFVTTAAIETAGLCHCRMCQRWTGSALAEVSLPMGEVTWSGREHIGLYASSDWGERAFCKTCGSGLWFRVTEDGEWSGNYDIPLGLFDDPSGFTLAYEIFVDQKLPTLTQVDQGQVRLTRAECVAKFARLAEDPKGPPKDE